MQAPAAVILVVVWPWKRLVADHAVRLVEPAGSQRGRECIELPAASGLTLLCNTLEYSTEKTLLAEILRC